MYASDKILENADVIKLLEHYGFNISHQESNMIRTNCKIHGGDNPTAFAINKDSTLWFCHTGEDCGGGDIFTLVEKMENINFPEAVQWLSSFYDVDITNLELSERKNRLKKELEQFISAMKRSKKKEIPSYKLPSDVKLVTMYRDFKLETLQHFGLGFVDSIVLMSNKNQPYELYNRLVFPIRFKGEIVGMSLRRTKSTQTPKWSHQPNGLETGNILYNYDAVQRKPVVVVCEGMLDVWAFHEVGIPAVCTFGAKTTEEQYKLLIKTGADLVFAFDGDKAGRKATKKAIEMFKHKANIFILEMNDGEDPSSITREELVNRYETRKRCNY